MPIIESKYSPPFLFRNGYISTIYPNMIRTVKNVFQKREQISLDDGDFIDLDWSSSTTPNSKNVAVIIHGLEGNGQRQYVLGLTKHLNNNGWDSVAMNLRNCSGEVNRLYRSYHAGVSEDLDYTIQHILKTYSYSNISLCGFSLGGNIMLKYLGENHESVKEIKNAVAVSVPCDLYNSLLEINKPSNYIYQRRFINLLKAKLYQRQILFPKKLSISDINNCKSLIDIDNLYTSKAHGYQNAMDYYSKCSSKQFIKHIQTPTLILNTKNDSFLGDRCYPIEESNSNKKVFLEIPDYGGHVGFYLPNNIYYNELRTLEFFKNITL
ncbi:YheT family hydrolase [Aquimarina sp. I32.4]|uniref:YheT family hydrolase n=1 Tax=Aquimarina sp. I32.4 TaxID=2053903 RepID=UPI000CDEC0A1|nr:alpha/beta fold hydrolase [Aquimarina sp. I32.4]